ncbi:MAG TPA: ATP-binding protein [Bacteroidetes bacterium]|nr:ATP-binding protein [Bacteroidota bacterium]
MKTQEVISSVIDSQRADLDKIPEGLTRELLGDIQVIPNFCSIISGIRRCGKSTLMLQLLKKCEGESLFLKFEDIRLAGFETADFSRLDAEIKKRGVKFLFFDEIQVVEGWEIFISQKLAEGFLVFITGSNASLLSRELGTRLTGRHLSYELHPFSYSEFLRFGRLKNSIDNFNDYLKTGGMPEFIHNKRGIILQQLVDDILYRDIAVRHNLRSVDGLREMTVFLVSNIGKPISARKLTGLFGISSTTTVTDYFAYLKDSYLLDFLPRFDYSVKAQSRNPKKIYAMDMGIYQQIKTTFTDDYGRNLENAVYLYLRRQKKDLFYFTGKGECDFVIVEKGKAQACIQVCFRLDDLNMKRELGGLKAALDYFGLKEGLIITYNQRDVIEYEGVTVRLLPAMDYML